MADGSQTRGFCRKARLAAGYTLFVALLVYAVRQWPDAVWDIEVDWLFLCALPMLVLALLQAGQVAVFLRVHEVHAGSWWVFEFAARRGALNALVPGRIGTLIMLREVTQLGRVRWQDYLGFSLLQSVQALAVSGLVLAALILPAWQAVALAMVVALVTVLFRKRVSAVYRRAFWPLFLLAVGIYLVLLAAFWMVLLALGLDVGVAQAGYFGVLLNGLAQVAITPGNMGVREALVGLMAKYVALPVSTGILAGAVFHAIRIAVYSAAILVARLFR